MKLMGLSMNDPKRKGTIKRWFKPIFSFSFNIHIPTRRSKAK